MTYTIDIKPLTKSLTDEQFAQLCAKNPELKFEINSKGELIIMSPTGSETGRRNSDLIGDFIIWNRQYKLGVVFDSSTGFSLPNGAKRSPDVSWINLDRWNGLTLEEKRGFAPIAPDFVLELMSPTDSLKDVQAKMGEYMDCGVRLGWIINPETKQVEIYRQGKEPELLDNPSEVLGEDVLPKLVINLERIWD